MRFIFHMSLQVIKLCMYTFFNQNHKENEKINLKVCPGSIGHWVTPGTPSLHGVGFSTLIDRLDITLAV